MSVQPAWHEIVCDTLKANSVRLVTYVPDNVLKPLIKAAHEDSYFTTFPTTREEEAVGIVAGACMAGMRGIVLMQTSGFGTLANVIASLPVAFQIPVLLMISERGVMGEFNLGQAMVNRTMRPVLDSLAMVNHTITRLDELDFILDRSIKQAVATRAPAAFILSPLLSRRKGVQGMNIQSPPIGPGNAQVMNRFALTKRLVAELKDEAVIGGIGNTNFDLWSAGHRPQNFYMLGSMGLACPIALGVALAQPQRRCIALEGDGSLLMQVGCLATIAMLKPKNLAIVVMDNRSYQITGGQPTATASGTDLVTMARGAGLALSAWAADEEMFDEMFARALTEDGPWLIAVRIDDKPGVGATERDPVLITDRFMRGLGTKG